MLAIGSAILALGVYFEVCANLLYVPGEGLVRAIAFKKKDFGRIKIIFDIILCILSIIISFIFLHKIQGLREGTILSAILVGSFVCLYQKIYKLPQCLIQQKLGILLTPVFYFFLPSTQNRLISGQIRKQ